MRRCASGNPRDFMINRAVATLYSSGVVNASRGGPTTRRMRGNLYEAALCAGIIAIPNLPNRAALDRAVQDLTHRFGPRGEAAQRALQARGMVYFLPQDIRAFAEALCHYGETGALRVAVYAPVSPPSPPPVVKPLPSPRLRSLDETFSLPRARGSARGSGRRSPLSMN